MKKLLATLSAVAMTFSSSLMLPATALAAVPLTQVQPGDLIRGASFSAVYYYGKDGFRYVFPNDKTYFTWYSNFNNVKFITDADLATIQIGGNVTYKPGVRMIKINTDPKTYAIGRGGALRWVMTEQAAVSLYGSAWNKQVDDVPDGFFKNYMAGADIEQASDFDKENETADATDIDYDKNLRPPMYIDIMDSGFGSPVTVSAGTAVRWTNKGTTNHVATSEDVTWGTGTLKPGESFTKYFKTPGTYTYFDSLYPNLKSSLIVQ